MPDAEFKEYVHYLLDKYLEEGKSMYLKKIVLEYGLEPDTVKKILSEINKKNKKIDENDARLIRALANEYL